ncbi:MAG: dynamin family protein, partial [Anaerolineales bacterium]
PGIGSSREENTATTYAFLPEVDVVIFVTSVEAPISEPEKKFLEDIRQHAHKLFLVVNKTDLLSPAELDQVMDYICEGISPLLGESNVRIYPLSAKQALDGKQGKDNQKLQQSGILEFEAALAAFLSQEKSKVFLLSILDRALRLLDEFRIEYLSIDHSTSRPQNRTALLMRISESMESLREMIQSSAEIFPSQVEEVVDTTIVQAPIEQAIEASQLNPKTGQKRGLVITRTCPICAAQSQSVWDFFVDWQYAITRDEDVRRAFRAAHGFCGVHTWQFGQIANAQGINEGYAPLIESVTGQLQALVGRPATEDASIINTLIPTVDSCPACRVLRQTSEAQIPRLLEEVSTPEGQARYSKSLGLCIPHLRLVLLSSPPLDASNFLLSEAANRLEEISEDMHSYVLKRDALRSGLLNSNEENAWRRALLQLAGERTAYAS